MEKSVSDPSSLFNSLPNEIITQIFSFCDPFSTPIAFVCHKWIDILKYNSGALWKSFQLEIDPIPSPFQMWPNFHVLRSLLKSGMLKNTDSFSVIHSIHINHKKMRPVNEITLPELVNEIFCELPYQCKFLRELNFFLPLRKHELIRTFESMTYLKDLSVNLHFFDDADFFACFKFCSAKIQKLTLENFYCHVKDFNVLPERFATERTRGISPSILPTIAQKFSSDLFELRIDFSKNCNNADRYLGCLAVCENLQVLKLEGMDWSDSTLENLIISLKKLNTLQLRNNEGANMIVIPEHSELKDLYLEAMYTCETIEIKAPNIDNLYLSQFEICSEVIIHCKEIEYLNITEMSPTFIFYDGNNFGSVKLPLKDLVIGNVEMSVEEFNNLLKNSSETLQSISIAGEFPNIEKLDLNLPVLEEADFEFWSTPKKCRMNCPKLKTLCLCNTNIKDISIKGNELKKFCKGLCHKSASMN